MNDDKTTLKFAGELMMGGKTAIPEPSMWTMTVVLDGQQALRFTYSNFERCQEAYAVLLDPEPAPNQFRAVRDDYGTIATIRRAKIRAINISDVARQADGESEVQMITALKQAELARRAKAEPRLQAGSGIFQPGGRS